MTAVEHLLPVVGLVVGVIVVTGLSGRIGVPAPIALVLIGVGASFVPGVPGYAVDPEFVLSVLIPPLLYAAAVESSVLAIRTVLRSIIRLSVGLVLVTAFAVGAVLSLVVPVIPFTAALALGAIVAPPDAVAAVAVARRVGLPRRVLVLLEGESLFNDASSLVLLRVATAALATGALAWGAAALDFLWASVGGLLIGAAVGLVASWTRRRLGGALAVTAFSLVIPYVAYLAAEAAGASGVLAVVVAGLVLGYRSPTEEAALVRLTETATWESLRYVLEGIVFALIGLQLRHLVGDPAVRPDHLTGAVAVVLATVVLVRPAYLFLGAGLTRLGRWAQYRWGREIGDDGRDRPAPPTWREQAVMSWAGMRGVVSLAAAQTLPLETPYRSTLILATVAVILATLVLQGLSLPWVIRRLGVAGDPRGDLDRERAAASAQAGAAIAARVEQLIVDGSVTAQQGHHMRRWLAVRDWHSWDDADTDTDTGAEAGRAAGPDAAGSPGRVVHSRLDWQQDLIDVQRDVFITMRNAGDLSEEALRELQHDLDLEEALLGRRTEALSGHLTELPTGRDEPDDGVPAERGARDRRS
ncbi:cation:proton antiporter [Nakamurella leprariae]|uniref:Sodium:proton antiporter n=1 Tax=Nakamurella leprariae TaxID=2803911 RepID=A0A938YBY9_9ACTN|nr:sodium:proton antiporter [Nakamurella leprariae]MBM9466791.1 sodium:proton antiporter [Nakamurella leprariae]